MENTLISEIVPHATEPPGPEPARLTRQDVMDLIEKNGGPEGLDLRGRDLSGINLSKLDLHGIVFGNVDILGHSPNVDVVIQGADLHGAWFERSNLHKANFGRTNLRGAHFYHADLTEATLWAVNAEGADFRKANLTRVDLFSAVLQNCRCLEARFVEANLYLTDLSGTTFSSNAFERKIIQESEKDYCDYFNRWYVAPVVAEKYSHYHLNERYVEAKEIYMNLKNAYLNSGRYEDASFAHFKERQMERKSYFPLRARKQDSFELPENCKVLSITWWNFHLKYTAKWLQAILTEAVLGYGERPMRVVFWSFMIILVFPLLYWLSNGVMNPAGRVIYWIDYLYYSLAAFSTIGFPDLVPANNAGKFLTSLEALLGISVLALLMFALGNRVSRS
jgi:uncharacterized protein YjbI with pentapeptide repeats